jgi:hypothetical protein
LLLGCQDSVETGLFAVWGAITLGLHRALRHRQPGAAWIGDEPPGPGLAAPPHAPVTCAALLVVAIGLIRRLGPETA